MLDRKYTECGFTMLYILCAHKVQRTASQTSPRSGYTDEFGRREEIIVIVSQISMFEFQNSTSCEEVALDRFNYAQRCSRRTFYGLGSSRSP